MSSLRPGLEPPSGQISTARSRRAETIYYQVNTSNSSHGTTSQLPSRIKMPSRELSNPRTRPAPMPSHTYSSTPSAHPSGLPTRRSASSSKIPQTSFGSSAVSTSQRRPLDPRQRSHSRPPLTHQSQPWSATASITGSTATTFVSNASATSSSRSKISHPASVPHFTRSAPNNLARARPQTQTQTQTQPPAQAQPHTSSRNNSGEMSSSSSAAHYDRTLTESPAELRIASKAEVTSAQTVTIYPELDRYRSFEASPSLSDQYGPVHPDMLFRLATESIQAPPTPYFSRSNSQVSGISASSSTRFSDSSGPGSYSRDTTPASMSSQSPGTLSSGRMPSAPRMRQPVRARTGSFGKDTPGAYTQGTSVLPTVTLAAIRESLNSSSSSSNGTIRSAERRENQKKKKRLSPTPPSPPPRTSSAKFRESGDELSPEKSRKGSGEHSRSRPSSSKSNRSKDPASPVPAIPKQHTETTSSGSPRPLKPPSRPSRDGTPNLHQLDFSLPIIQSNLSHAPISTSDHLGITHAVPPPSSTVQPEQRQLAPSAMPLTQRDGLQSLQRPREASRIPPLSKADDGSRSSREQGRTTRSPSPNVSTFRTRFPLFGRRAKNASGTADAVSTRKGPVAGTGHEGYGRMGSSRRRSSSVSTFLRGTVSSQESLAGSPQFQDPFLRDRMSPVVIAGGEIIENKNTGYDLSRTGSSTSASVSASASTGAPTSYPRPSTDSLSSREDRATMWPSVLSRGLRRPSDSSDSEAAMRSTLAYRRSVQRLQSPDGARIRVPRPIVVRPPRPGMPPSVDSDSLDASVMTDDSAPYAPSQSELRGRKSSEASTRKLTKQKKSPRRWNLFGRSHSQPATSKKALNSTSTVAVTVETVVSEKAKPIAFYAMIDSSEPEDGDVGAVNVDDVDDVEDILHQARRPSIEQVSLGEVSAPAREAPQPQPLQQPQPDTALSTVPMLRSGRPSRLPQVGRIPKVVSARPDQTSPKSFSRPFNRISVQLLSAASTPLLSPDAESIAKGPTPPGSATPDLMHDGSTVTHLVPTPEVGFLGSAEFFTMASRKASRKDSNTTSGTSSSGVYSFADATAIVPSPSAPLAEDEIWDEYDDLLEVEDGPVRVRASTTSSHGMPFHLEADVHGMFALESPTVAAFPGPSIDEALHYGRPVASSIDATPRQGRPPVASSIDETPRQGRVASSIYSTDIIIENADDSADSAGQRVSCDSQPPATPFSVSEFVAGYGDRDNSAGKVKKTQRSSGSSGCSKRKQLRASDGSVYSQVSEDNSPISQVNLRVGSMTVSKWLTFGHVLFSPARDNMVAKVSPPNDHSVLVIDGLGNDDWSFYAAETYPAATFFNLSPRAPLVSVDPSGSSTPPAAFPTTPPNHHQIQYTSSGDKLPFQAEIFTTVVYRFPTAAPASHYRNIINEARRVLKPGGYLELSILDLDLNNMGPRTRRAVRHLKEQTHTHTPDMHLGSTADVILRLLGTRGFADVKSCRVGIPAASAIFRGGSSRGSGEVSNDVKPAKTAQIKPTKTTKTAKTTKDQRSLAEMINDESPVADESITNMVARVGRWWHSRCYGDAAMGPSVPTPSATSASMSRMWTDRALLAECEEWRTNLKLTVCYARAPDIKRVASI